MARGGRRQGKPGSQYPNRRDLQQAPRAAPGQEYGQRKAQLDAQQAIPLPSAPPPGTAAMAGRVGGGAPVMVPSLNAPTARPSEPLTAGLPSGAGPGPEALDLPINNPDNELLGTLQGLYRAFPNQDLARLIAEVTARGPSNAG